MRILTVDIETRPSIAYIWSLWDKYTPIERLVEAGEVISWAAKWNDRPKVHFASVFHNDKEEMAARIWDLFDAADAVVHFNGRRFDIPHLNLLFLQEGLKPPAPYAQIDLLDTVKRQFNFVSNKLAFVSRALGIGGKVPHTGFDLWERCMAGDRKAWKKMREYNIGDVLLTEQLYNHLLPWIQRHPSHGALTGKDVCPACGSDNLQSRGMAHTRTGAYQRYCCQNCGKWSRATRRSDHTNITEVAA